MGRIALLVVLVAVGLVCRAASAQNDIDCLKQFKESVRDPQGYLSGWNFSSAAEICLFNGVTCLHPNDSKVYTLSLSGVGLSGTFPSGLSSCHSLTSLDLSDNGFTGPIPTNLCQMLPYLVTFNVRGNSIAGTMSSTFNNCTYLNTLDVSHNKLSGSIPGEVGLLSRLSKFDVSFNQLSGPIPYTFSRMPASSFANNRGLCGRPLKDCKSSGKSRSRIGLVAGVSAGGVVLGLAVAFIWLLPKVRPRKDPAAAAAAAESKWAKRIKAPSSVTVSVFEKPLAKLKLADLMAATNDFSAENIIMSGRTGVIYKASFADGSVMAIKRLRHSQQSDKEFKSEMETLGVLRHRNLVPLLGYCIADTERLLVYKHMSNGSLKDWLHAGQTTQYSLDWSKRLKIAIGASRGLAWLHHSCNPRIIHRNISAASILLDDDFEAKITDFGLARLMNPVDTHISTFVNGDFGEVGYVAPEYVRTLVATSRGDVYSLGVVLLELVTGQKPVDVQDGGQGFKGNLVEWVAMHNRSGSLAAVVQDSLRGTPDVDAELLQVLKVALSCVAGAARERPSAYEVYQLLRAIGQKYHFSDQNEELPLVDSSSVVLDVEQQRDEVPRS